MTSMINEPAPEPRILIAEGPWSMKEPIAEPAYDIVVHKCKWKDNWFLNGHSVPASIMLGEDPYCMNCNEKVPNMFKTLWTLKNMEKIQAGAQYGDAFVWASSFYLTDMMLNAKPGQIIQYTPSLPK